MPWRVELSVVPRRSEIASTQVFEQDEIVVGRTARMADLVLLDGNVSRRHCAFRVTADGQLRLVDLGSTNGIWVNGRRVSDREFVVGDELMAGDHVVTLVEPPRRVELAAPVAECELVRHPQSTSTAIERVVVLATPIGGELELRYRAYGDLDRVVLPSAWIDPDRLWEHTVFELFAAGEGDAYTEWNFSPTGQCARFAFCRYRERTDVLPAPARIRVTRDSNELTVTARGQLLPEAKPVDVGLSAITKDTEGAVAYWALTHSAERPDFHQRESFTLALDV